MNVRDNKVKKSTQTHRETSTKATPELHPTPVPGNQIDSGTTHTRTSQWVIFKTKLHLWFKQWRDTWLPVINVAIGLFALIVIVFQSRIYNEQSKAMRAQTELIQKQTQIMEKSFGLSENSVRMSERAYVSVASLTVKLADKQVLIQFGNNGTVPATSINVDANVYRATPSPGDSKLKNFVSRKFLWGAGPVALFPGNFRMSVVIPLQDFNQEEMKAVLAKKEILYVAGSISYEDRNGTKDKTPFAYEYDPLNDTWIANSELSKFFNQNGH